MSLGNKHSAPPSPHAANRSPPKAFGKIYFFLGLTLFSVFLLQQAYHWRLNWLTQLQTDNVYKQLSGFALFTFLAHQWHCSVLRSRGLMRKAGRILNRHKLIGSLAPLVFYAHTQTLGFAYLQILSLFFFAIFLTGLFNFEITRIDKVWFHPIWIIVHVSLSTGLLFLLGFHIFISYAYQ
ncbi:MAG: hypothetical protein ACU83N_14960 [Gammaproteobacteria bacterium]